MIELLGLKKLNDDNRSIFEKIIIEHYEKGDNSDLLKKIVYHWEDDTRKHEGIPPRVI